MGIIKSSILWASVPRKGSKKVKSEETNVISTEDRIEISVGGDGDWGNVLRSHWRALAIVTITIPLATMSS
jgi:hypothetical protein